MASESDESEWEEVCDAADNALAAEDYEAAAEKYQRALELAEQHELGDEYVADSLEGLAAARSCAGAFAEAEAIEHRASEIRDRLLSEEEVSVPPDHAAIAECLDRCAFHRLREGMGSEAIRLFERALHIRRSMFGDNHFEVANSITILASAHSSRDHYSGKAGELWKDAVKILETLFARTETRTYEVVASLTGNLENLAMRAYEQDDFDTAEGLFRRVVAVNSTFFGHEGWEQLLNSPAFARILMHRGKLDEAESVLKAACSDHHLAAARRQALIELYETTGRKEEAESVRRKLQ